MKRIWNAPAILIALAVAVVSLGGLTSAVVVHGQTAGAYDTSLLSGLKWRSVGPLRGGRSIAVAGSSSRLLEYYFGATGGGLWKTTDGGTTWRPVSDKFFKTSSVGAVAVSESNPDIVYVGMGETELRGNIIQGDGVYKSIDGGKAWTQVGLKETQAISRIRIHPTNPDLVYVSALGHPYGPNDARGVFRSKDGGKTWEKVLFKSNKAGAVDLAMDPRNPSVLYASIWEAFRTPHSLSSGGPEGGLFKTTDGGSTWTELTRNPGLPKGIIGKSGIAVSGADSNRVYAIVEAEDGGVFVSDDAGASWKKVNEERRLRQRAFYYTRIYADPKERETVYVLNTGFYRSTDGGKSYKAIRVPHGDNHDLWIAANDPRRMINSNDGGANVSVNGGETWTEQDYPTAQFYHVFTTKHLPYHVCGAQQDNSTACVSSAPGGGFERTAPVFYAAGGGESGYIAPDPRDPDVFYAGSYGGLLTRLDRKTGQMRVVNAWPDNPMGHSAKDITERFQWTFPIVFSPVDPNVLYASSQHLFRSTSGGQSWDRISPDLTRADPGTMGPSGGPITLDQTGVETYATIFTVAPSRRDVNTIWTGSDDGVVHITRDGGKTWEKVTPTELPDFSRISLIEASPHKPGTAYLAANRYQREDRQPYVFRTDDYGKTWTKIVSGIPADDFARAIREDPTRDGLLYLGTEHGIYVSFNNGASWQSLALDLPVTPVHGIIVEEKDLVIGTHGRAFYILDNIGVLRQLRPETTNEAAHLFDPADVIRSVDRGVAIDYYLKQAADKVTIEIIDAQGQVVRSFTGTAEEQKKAEAATADQEEEFFRPRPPQVGTKPGINRLVWDLRYSGWTEFPGIIFWAAANRGPVAAPGTYQVRLTASGQTLTESLGIRKDPRLASVTDADLQEQFRFSLQIRDKVSQANEAVIAIRRVKDQLKDRKEKADKAKKPIITAAADALAQKLGAIEVEIYQVKNQSNQDPLNYPIKLNNKLGALLGVVQSADSRPTDQSYAVFKEHAGRLDAEIAKLMDAFKTDVTKLNALLQKQKLAPIEVEPAKPAAAKVTSGG